MVKDEEAAIARRQRIAEMLMQQGQEPIETQTAGGYVVPVSPLSGVAKVAQQLAGAYMGKQADKQRAELEQKRFDDLSAIDFDSPDAANQLMKNGMVAEAIKLRTGKKEASDKIPTGFRPNEDGSIAPMPIAGGGNFMDYQIQLANQKAQIPGYGEPERLQMSKEDQAMQRASQARDEERLRLAQEAADRQEKAASEAKLQNVPAQHRMAHAENTAALKKIDDAIAAIQANPGALGLKNLFGDNVSQRLDEKGVPVRAAVADVGGVKLHDLSGAAISPSESKRLMPLIPQATDSPEAAIAKLQNLRKEYAGINSQIESMYSGPEYRNPMGGGNINIDIKDPANDTPEARAAIAADIAKDQKKAKVIRFDANGNMVQ